MRKLLLLCLLLILLSVSGKCEELIFEATAYTKTGNPTASGVYPFSGCIASDNSILPIGTIVYVDGYGYAVVLDCGGNIKGNRIDLYFNDHKTCIKWGRKKVKVKILRKP